MKLNRNSLRRMILAEIHLLTESYNLSQEDKFKDISKNDIKRFPRRGTGYFIVFNHKHKDFKGKGSEEVLRDHNVNFKNWKRGKFKFELDNKRIYLTFIAEIPGVFGDVISASNLRYLDMQFKASGYKASEYHFYKNTMTKQLVAVKKDSAPDNDGGYKESPYKPINNPGV